MFPETFEDADHSLLNIYEKVTKALKEVVETYGEPENPRLRVLKDLIHENYKQDKNSKGILFSTTRESTIALESWIQECDDLKCVLNPKRLVGTADGTVYTVRACLSCFILFTPKNHKVF